MCFVELLKWIGSILNYSLKIFNNKYSNSFHSYKNKTTKISQNMLFLVSTITILKIQEKKKTTER